MYYGSAVGNLSAIHNALVFGTQHHREIRILKIIVYRNYKPGVFTPRILALGRLRQEDILGFKVSLGSEFQANLS